MSLNGPALLAAAILLFIASSSSACAQFAQVEVSEILFGTGPTQLSSSADGPFDLLVGVTGLEASATIDPASAPLEGVSVDFFVQANSIDAPFSSASAFYEFEFSLPLGAQELFLVYIPQNVPRENIATSSFRLTRDQTEIFAASDEPLFVEGGLLSPGDYQLTIEAEAIASSQVANSFASASPQLLLNFVPVPEPSSLPIFILAAVVLSLRYRPDYLPLANNLD